MRAGNGELGLGKSRLVSSPRLFVTWCKPLKLFARHWLGWTEEAMIAGSRDVGVSPSIVGSFSRKEAALVEVNVTISFCLPDLEKTEIHGVLQACSSPFPAETDFTNTS
ncbi:hypothetical protein HID58_025901, partial [Brassica napus]